MLLQIDFIKWGKNYLYKLGSSIKYVRSTREGGGQGMFFMASFYCLKAYKMGGGVWKSPNMSVHTL